MCSFLLVMEKRLVSLMGSSHVWLPKDGSSTGVNRNCTFSLEISEAIVAYECTTTQTTQTSESRRARTKLILSKQFLNSFKHTARSKQGQIRWGNATERGCRWGGGATLPGPRLHDVHTRSLSLCASSACPTENELCRRRWGWRNRAQPEGA